MILRYLLLLVLIFPPALHAKDSLRDLAVHEDIAGTLSFEEVLKLPDERFTPLPHGLLSAGYQRSVHWLRFSLSGASIAAGQRLLEIHPTYLDDVRLYEPDPADPARYVERRSGDTLPFDRREVAYRGFVFALAAAADDAPRTYYLRLQTSSTSLLIPKLWHAHDFHATAQAEYLLLGGMLGLMLIIVVINLIHWLNNRDELVLIFVAYIGVALINTVFVQGLASQFLLPSDPATAGHLQLLSTMLMTTFASLLYRSVLLVQRSESFYWWAYQALAAFPLLAIPALFLGYATEALRLAMSLGLFLALVGLVRSIQLFLRRTKGAALVLVAVVFSILGILVSLAQILGLIPGNFVVAHAIVIGLTGNIVAFHLAVAIRTRTEREEQERMAQQSRDAEARAQRERSAREEQEAFIMMLAHEIKTPLASIAAANDAIEIISEGRQPEIQTRVDRIRRAFRRLAGISDRYFAMSRADARLLEPHPVCFRLRKLVTEVAAQTGEAERLQIDCDDALELTADANLIATALYNLIDNALKYSAAEQPIHIRVETLGDEIVLKVLDRGSGIPETLREEIFKRFYRSPEHGAKHGIGVGLWLVRRIVEAHGGRVSAHAREGGGSGFEIVLPQAPPETSGFVS